MEALGFALEQKQKRYDTAYELADKLADQQIQALQADRARANELTRGWNQKIDDMVTKYDGDYSRMYKELGALKRDITRTMGPGGEGGAIQTNYSNYHTWLKGEQDRMKKGEITAQQLRLASAYELGNYTGAGQVDPVSGNFNQLNPGAIAKYVNADELLYKALDNMAAEEGGSIVARPDGFYIKKSGNKFEKVTADRIARVTNRTLRGNQEYMQYMGQSSVHQGIDPEGAVAYDVMQRAANMVDIYRKDNKWYESDLRPDSSAMKLFELQLEQQMRGPDGWTKPGQIQNTTLENMKVDLTRPSKFSAFGHLSGAGTSSPGVTYEPDKYKTTASELISSTRSKLANQAPALVEAFDATVSDLKNSEEYKSASAREQQKLIQDAWNAKIDKVQTTSINDLAFGKELLQQIQMGWQQGLADGAYYQRIKGDGSLGKIEKASKVGDVTSRLPVAIKMVDGKVGLEYNLDGKQYLVTNTILDGPAQQYMEPFFKMRALYDGQMESMSFSNKPYPVEGPDGKPTLVGAPEGSTIEFKFDKDMNRIGVIKDSGGKKIGIMPAEYVNAMEGDYARKASGRLSHNIGVSTQYTDYGDAKQMFDNY